MHGSARARCSSLRGALYWLLWCSGCLYDADHRCGDDRHLAGLVCVCNAGTEERGGKCQPAVPDAGMGGPGAGCDRDEDCSELGERRLCKHTTSGEGYCTQSACSTNQDCPESFFCVTDADSFCSRPPTGQGKSCNSASDCQGLDASFCGVGDPRGATCWVPGNCRS